MEGMREDYAAENKTCIKYVEIHFLFFPNEHL